MIEGWFDDSGQIFFEIELIAANGEIFSYNALLDTGCTDWLAINEQDLQGLGWSFLRKQTKQTAKGEFEFDIYAGKVRFDDQEIELQVVAGEAFTEILLGVPWLRTRRLVVDFPLGLLTLG